MQKYVEEIRSETVTGDNVKDAEKKEESIDVKKGNCSNCGSEKYIQLICTKCVKGVYRRKQATTHKKCKGKGWGDVKREDIH